MAGEIHGLISREDMWRMWAPYGERVELDGDLNPDSITTNEALQVTLGSNNKWFYRIWSNYYSEDRQDVSWQDGLREAMLNPSEELLEDLVGSNRKQQQFAKEAREKAIAGGLELTGQLGAAARLLVNEGLLTPKQADAIDTWLVASDGQPFMQYTPMSRLEYGRLALRYDKEDCGLTGNDCTDFSLGILRSAISLRKATRPWQVYNRIHESVHGGFSGIEAWDITRDDGWRHPEATVIGHFAYKPTTEVGAGDDFSGVENCEVNEGWTEFIARSLMRVNSTLGKPLKLKGGYGKWGKTMATIQKNDPGLFAVITDTALAEATPQCPNAKREALADMHVYAARRLGGTTLDQLFLESGGSLLDIFTKGKEKVA